MTMITTVYSQVWNPPLHQGDHIILKGIESPDIKYIVTWTLNDFHNAVISARILKPIL